MTYAELLMTNEWKEKSLHIKKRDEFRCQRCQNLIPIKTYALRQMRFRLPKVKKGYLVSCGFMKEEMYKEKYTILDLEFSEILSRYTVTDQIRLMLFTEQGDSDSDFISHLGTCFLDRQHYQYNGPVGSLGGRKRESILKYEIELQNEIEGGLYKELDWIELNLLHTHHKYYQKGKLPWEYPDSALITLCWRCHELEHQNKTIDMYDSNMNLCQKMTNCKRCHGAGIFPKYNHVQNGICFRCDGAKYEELIGD